MHHVDVLYSSRSEISSGASTLLGETSFRVHTVLYSRVSYLPQWETIFPLPNSERSTQKNNMVEGRLSEFPREYPDHC